MRITDRRPIGVLLFLLILTASPGFAAGRPSGAAGGGIFERATWMTWLRRLSELVSLRGEAGMFIDPNGGTTASSATPSPTLTSVRGEDGVYIDPNGGAKPLLSAKRPTSGLGH